MLDVIAVLATALGVSIAGLLRVRRALALERRHRLMDRAVMDRYLDASYARRAVAEAEQVVCRAFQQQCDEQGDDDE